MTKNKQEIDIVIIGAGLSGLYLGNLLHQKGLNFLILEARDRTGGRIFTKRNPSSASIDLGATWLGKKHKSLIRLLNSLDIGIVEQELSDRAVYEPISTSPHQLVQLPPNTDPSFRIHGGTSTLIEALEKKLKPESIRLNEAIKEIQTLDNGLLLTTNRNSYQCKIAVSTLPPNLFMHSIQVEPQLPDDLRELALQTHTWMGESIKVALSFPTPFWEQRKYSATIFSNVGPVSEMYEHNDPENMKYALKGFMNGSYFSITQEERKKMILQQLRKYFGSEIDNYLEYEEKVWRNEEFTFAPYRSHVLPHQHNGHEMYRKPYLENKLFFAGAETASEFPGYMEGAILRAEHVLLAIGKGI